MPRRIPWYHILLGLVLFAIVLSMPRRVGKRGILPLDHIVGTPVLSLVLDYGEFVGPRGSHALQILAKDAEVLACMNPWIADPDRAFPRWAKFVADVSGLDLTGGVRFLSHRLSAAWFGSIEVTRRDGRAAELPDLVLAVEFDHDLTEVARLVEALRTEPLIWGLGVSYDTVLAGQRMSHYVSNDPEGLEAFYGVIDRTLILTTCSERMAAFLVRLRGGLRASLEDHDVNQLACVVWDPPTPLPQSVARVGWVQDLQRWLSVLSVSSASVTERVAGSQVETVLRLSRNRPATEVLPVGTVGLETSGLLVSLPIAALAKLALEGEEARPGFTERMRRGMIQDLLLAGGDRLMLRWSDLPRAVAGEGLDIHLPLGDPTRTLGALRRASLFSEISVRGEADAFQVMIPWQGKEILLQARALASGGLAIGSRGAPQNLDPPLMQLPFGIAGRLSPMETSWLLRAWTDQQGKLTGWPAGPRPEHPDVLNAIGSVNLECETKSDRALLLGRSSTGLLPLVPLLLSDR